MKLIQFFIERRVITLMLALGLLVFGIVGWIFLPVASLPDVEYPIVNVTASLPGASPEIMATAVAAPLERQLAGVRGVDSMKSYSYEGVTYVQLRFSLGRDIDAAGADVQAAINHAEGDLPRDLPAPPRFYKKNPADRPILALSFTSDSMTTPKIDAYVDNLVVRRIGSLPGVSSAYIADPQKYAVRIELNPVALAARGLSPEDVRQAIGRASINRPKGKLTGGGAVTSIDANDQLFDAATFRQIIVSQQNDRPVRLSDVAMVEDGLEDEHNFGWFNGRPAIIIGIIKNMGANVVATVDGIRNSIEQIIADLPPGIKLEVIADRAEVIRASLRDVEITLAITTALVVLVILLFLRRLWATVIPSITIPLSLIGTLGVMALLRFSLDNLSLMALTISVGFVVDDAIVVIENIARHLDAGMSPLQAAMIGGRQVAFTILSITVSLVAVFIPVFFMDGVLGRLFSEFAATVSIAILLSAIVALTITPMLCRWLLPPHDAHPPPPGRFMRISALLYDRVFSAYHRSVLWVLRHRAVTLAVFMATIATTAALYVVMPKGFFPTQDNSRLIGDVEGPPGMTFEQMVPIVRQLSDIIRADPDVAADASYVNPDSSGDFMINLRPRQQRSTTARQVMERLREKTQVVGGGQLFMQPEQELTIDANVGRAEYTYVLVDSDRAELEQWGSIVEAHLKQVPGLLDISLNNQPSGPAAHVVVNRELAARMGIDLQSVDDVLYDCFGGRHVAEIFTDSSQYYALMEVAKPYQTDKSSFDLIRVSANDGRQVPLSSFAHIEPGTAPLAVAHTGRFPSKGISFNLAPGLSLGEALERIKKMEHDIGKPPSLQTSFEGTAREFQNGLKSQVWLIAAALFVVYVVLGVLYESFIHPLTILSSLPSAGLGALLVLQIMGMNFDVMGIIGILLLIGIVKKNAIMMIDFAIQAESAGKGPEEAILQACLVRFRPIMMTTIAALFGALPLALGSGAGSELRRPLGFAIVGGLVISQFLTLYSTPVIHLLLRQLTRRQQIAVPDSGAASRNVLSSEAL
jgi:hydrophobe/amphiphile efflux-1 (HAE1) family protein